MSDENTKDSVTGLPKGKDQAEIDAPYEYPFKMASEEEIRFRDAGAVEGRPAGVPSSYDQGGSTRWTPEAISEVHALAQLGRYQVRGFNTFNKQLPTFDDLTFVPATMTRLPLEGYREKCETKTILEDGSGLFEKPLELDIPIYIASMSFLLCPHLPKRRLAMERPKWVR